MLVDSFFFSRAVKVDFFRSKFFHLFKFRYGTGKSIIYYICAFSGIHSFINLFKLVKENFEGKWTNRFCVEKISNFFFFFFNSFDKRLKKKKIQRVKEIIRSQTIRGRKLELWLPVRGQRNRTNGRTRKKSIF